MAQKLRNVQGHIVSGCQDLDQPVGFFIRKFLPSAMQERIGGRQWLGQAAVTAVHLALAWGCRSQDIGPSVEGNNYRVKNL